MAEDSGILQEIDEALRADRLQQFWAHNSGFILVCCVLAVLSTAASAIWKGHMHEVHQRQTGRLAQAALFMDSGKYDEAVGLFEQVESDGGQLAALAALRHAQALLGMHRPDKAIAMYNGLAAGKNGGAEIYRDYAALQADILSHDAARAAGKAPEPLPGAEAARLAGRPFASAFAEIDALRLKDPRKAAALLEKVISDDNAPFSERARAVDLLDSIRSATP